jgi:hypothetical protein
MESDLDIENECQEQELLEVLPGVAAFLLALLPIGPILLWTLIS